VRGAIAAGHPCTVAAGAGVLAGGGNAVDAAVAAALAAFVAEGPLTGPAGGGFLLVAEPGGAPVLYDAFFAAPAKPFGELEDVVVDFADASTQTFRVGLGTVAVPGLVLGLEHVHRRHGRLGWAALVEPAIELAREGVETNDAQVFLHTILAAILNREEAGRRIYGRPERLVTDDLVPSLQLLRDHGAPGLAELLPELAADLDAYAVELRAPLQVEFCGGEVLTTPAPSKGGAVVTRALAELQRSGLGGAAGSPEEALALTAALAAGYGGSAPSAPLTGTTQVSVVDEDGVAVAISSTLGSGAGVFRHGFQLNNMLGEVDIVGHEPKDPGQRLASMMTPTLVQHGGRPRLVLGSAGSVRLAGAIVQVIAGVIGQGLPVEEAIDRPRLHVEQDGVHLEGGWALEVASALVDSGHEVVPWAGRNLYFGGVAAVEVVDGGKLAAAGDPRRGGAGTVVGP
jgi:gamma-glutamyltranspeptidase / glutathione hydrolase